MTTSATYCLGMSHHTAPVALRECVCSSPAELKNAWEDHAHQHNAIQEWVVLSTCNRFELYVQMPLQVPDAQQQLLSWLQQARPFDPAAMQSHFYFYRDEQAARHLLRVAAGLDSQVLGEPQILGQVADALAQADENRSVGLYLRAFFQAAIRTGKRVRTETAIGRQPSSISSVAIAHIEAANGPIATQDILVVGAGDMAQLAVNGLVKRGVHRLMVANRTVERAQAMLGSQHGPAAGLDQVPAILRDVDVLISATGAPHIVIDREMIAAAMKARPERPLTLVDIAVPRDIDPAVAAIPGVLLINMDELHDNLESARLAREDEIPAVAEIIEQELHTWRAERQVLEVRPVIRQLRQKAESIRRRELERTLKFMGDVDPDTRKHIQHLSRALVNQLLHEPTLKLREKAGTDDATEMTMVVQDLFNLPV